MSKLSKVIKIGAIALSTVGGAVEVGNIIVNQYNDSQVVEQYNFENVHEINVFDTYVINGEEVSVEEFEDAKEARNSITTRVTDRQTTVIDEAECTIYFGVATEKPDSLSELTKVEYESTPATFAKELVCTDEYAVFAVPNGITVNKIVCGMFDFTDFFETYQLGNYTVYITSELSDDTGYEYVLYLEK